MARLAPYLSVAASLTAMVYSGLRIMAWLTERRLARQVRREQRLQRRAQRSPDWVAEQLRELRQGRGGGSVFWR